MSTISVAINAIPLQYYVTGSAVALNISRAEMQL